MSCNCQVFKKAVDTVRVLAADGVQKANSGHPGMPMGCADFAFTLWSRFMRFDPAQPEWLGRDRFVLSAGHGSMLIYSLLHLFGYGLELDDLKQFRQWGSKCPGHPEYGHTKGVEVTTGPLASGLASAIGMAIGMKQFQARIGADASLFNQKVYAISGDGCIMEGTSHEACALAGHLKLDNLVLFYDDNSITIEGSTAIAHTEDVGARFAAYGWNVLRIDGQDIEQISGALQLARKTSGKPTIIIGKTVIGKGSPKLAGNAECHGAPLGADELAATKKALGFDPEQSFVVPADVRELCNKLIAEKKAAAAEWNQRFVAFKATLDSEKLALMDALLTRKVPANILEELLKAVPAKATATRNSGGEIMQKAAALQAKGPVALCLTRQNLPNLPADIVSKRMDVAKGAYVVSCEKDFEIILIASGSELQVIMGAADILRGKGKKVRVVSMPSWELFDKQSAEYKESVLPATCQKRISVEAGSTFGWQRYIGSCGLALGIDHFGASAPCELLAKEYGFSAEAVAEHAIAYLG